jgi:hypothetical protein
MIDWVRYSRLLLTDTEVAATSFFANSPGYDLSAIGYTFELGNASPAFSMVVNSHAFFRKTREEYRKHSPRVSEDELRWSSGDFEYCSLSFSGLCQQGSEWEREYVTLHEFACRNLDSNEVYDGLVKISCETLAILAKRGTFGDWRGIDFNVAEYCDDVSTMKQRHREIVEMMEAQG